MDLLNLKTVFVFNISLSFICALIFALLWFHNKNIFKGMFLWVVGMGFEAIGSILIILRGVIPDLWSIVLANFLVILGIFLFYYGFRIFINGSAGKQIYNYIYLSLFPIFFYYFTFIDVNLSARTDILAFSFLFFSVQCAWFSFFSVRPEMRKFTYGVGFVFIFYALSNIVRLIFTFINRSSNNDFFASNQLDIIIVLIYSLLTVLLAYSLILSVNRRLYYEVGFREEKFKKAFNASPYAITITKLSDGKIIEVNEAVYGILGFKPFEVLGKTTISLNIWENFNERERFINLLSKDNKIKDGEFKLRKKNGEIILCSISAEIIEIAGEKCILSSFVDITKQRSFENELKRTNDFMMDRELKMIELKEKLKELEEKNKQK